MSTAKKWLVGCGCGCAVVILILVGLAAGSFYLAKDVVGQFEEAEAAMEDLTRRHGEIVDFCPNPDGTIGPERLEIFLDVRARMATTRTDMEQILGQLSAGQRNGPKSPAQFLAMAKAGMGMVPEMVGFLTRRSEALLEVEMGLGEYYYIYAVGYYCWLGKSPADGPPFPLTEDHGGRELNELELRGLRREQNLRRLNNLLLPMLRNQLSGLDEASQDPDWRGVLEAEIGALENDPARLPWRDGLPERLEESLAPFAEDFEKSYSKLCNPLEIGPGVAH